MIGVEGEIEFVIQCVLWVIGIDVDVIVIGIDVWCFYVIVVLVEEDIIGVFGIGEFLDVD